MLFSVVTVGGEVLHIPRAQDFSLFCFVFVGAVRCRLCVFSPLIPPSEANWDEILGEAGLNCTWRVSHHPVCQSLLIRAFYSTLVSVQTPNLAYVLCCHLFIKHVSVLNIHFIEVVCEIAAGKGITPFKMCMRHDIITWFLHRTH